MVDLKCDKIIVDLLSDYTSTDWIEAGTTCYWPWDLHLYKSKSTYIQGRIIL
jgi:hypothetical protein